MAKKIFAILMVASVLGILVGGCGEKKDDAAPASTATTTTGTTPPATTTGK